MLGSNGVIIFGFADPKHEKEFLLIVFYALFIPFEIITVFTNNPPTTWVQRIKLALWHLQLPLQLELNLMQGFLYKC